MNKNYNYPSSDVIEGRLHDSLKQNPGINFVLDIINKCNLRCFFCSFSKEEVRRSPLKSFSPEEFKVIFDDIAPYVWGIMLSCSAEPLTSKHFHDILSIVSSSSPAMRISFCTNAMLMNSRVRHDIIQKGVTDIFLSMDGATKSTLESIRVGSIYEQIVGNIMALRDLKRASGSQYPRMNMIFIIMNSNIHEAPTFVELSKRVGADVVHFQHLVGGNKAEVLHNHKAKYNYYHEQVLRASQLHNIEVHAPLVFDVDVPWKPDENISCVDLSDYEKVEPDAAEGPSPIPKHFASDLAPLTIAGNIFEELPETFCRYPFYQILTSDLNTVLPCPFYKKPLGLLSDGQSLLEIFFGDGYRHLRHNMFLPEGDPYCRGCPVKTGAFPERR